MITLRHERPADIPAREALLDQAFGAARPQEDLAAAARRPLAGRRPCLRRRRRRQRGRHRRGSGRSPAPPASRPCCSARSRCPLIAAAAASVPRWCGARLPRRAGSAMAPSSWSAMRPTTAASASPLRRPARLKLPGPFERHRLLALELEPGALDGARGLDPRGRPAPKPKPDLAAPAPPNRQRASRAA